MMSKKQWFVLLCLFVIYLLLGASFFYHIENREETEKHAKEKKQRLHIEELLRSNYIGSLEGGKEEIFERLTEYCDKPVYFERNDSDFPVIWDYYHAVFFVVTVCTTVGYGNLAPTTMAGRIFMIFYALVGVPVNGILMVNLGDFFGRSFTKLYRRWKTSKMEYDTAKLGLIAQIILYLLPGFTLLIFIPSVIIMIFEGWDYDVAVYYAFVTLSTIGFGDYVAAVQDNNFPTPYFTAYKIFLLVWIIIGLGYLVMVMGFISRAYKSKRLHELEHMLAHNIKRTPQKIREEIRNLLHDILLTKVKRVYREEVECSVPIHRGRSCSCPDLALYRNIDSPTMTNKRKRAFSESVNKLDALPRNQSDTELDRIDKDLTFQPSSALVNQSDLLLRVVSALGNAIESSSSEESLEGVTGFSDREILASENYGSAWTLDNQKSSYTPPKFIRPRASSEIKFPFSAGDEFTNANPSTMTWYGPAATQRLQELRSEVNKNKSRCRTHSVPAHQPLAARNVFARIRNTFKKDDDKAANVDLEKQDYLQRTAGGRSSSVVSGFQHQYLRQTSQGRDSGNSGTPDHYMHHTRRGRTSSALSDDPILEQTSIAELFRVLTAITDDEPEHHHRHHPRRKMGTASLTPPEDVSPPRSRRLPIRSNILRRSSAASSHTVSEGRRFSLMPVTEQVVLPPPPPYTPRDTGSAGSSVRVPGTNRRFSLRPVNWTTGTQSPVQRQVWKSKEKDERKEM